MNTREYLDVFNSLPSHGWLTCEEGLLLVSYAVKTSGQMVEVGSYMGRSACLLGKIHEEMVFNINRTTWERRWVKARGVYCIDPWDDTFSTDYTGDEIFEIFQKNVRGLKVIPVRLRVEETLPYDTEFIYLDGDHTYQGTLNQINYAIRCTPRYITIHDVNDNGEGEEVKRAALSLLGPWKERVGRVAVWEIAR